MAGCSHPAKRLDLGQQGAHQAAAAQQLQAARRVALGHDHHQLVADALGGDLGDRGGGPSDRVHRGRFDSEIEPGREANRAQHAQAILGETLTRIADRADYARTQVAPATDEVDHAVSARIVIHAADSEVAPHGIGLKGAEMHGRGPPPVEIRRVGAESGDFKGVAVDHHHDDAEFSANRNRVGEQTLHHFGARVSGDIEILGLDAQDAVTHTAPRQIGHEALIAQPSDDCQGLGWFRSIHRNSKLIGKNRPGPLADSITEYKRGRGNQFSVLALTPGFVSATRSRSSFNPLHGGRG